MADRYLLESGAPDGYQLEDGSGVLLLDVPVAQTDNFERRDLGPNWTVRNATPQIYGSSDLGGDTINSVNIARWAGTPLSDDQSSEITISTIGVGEACALARINASGALSYYQVASTSGYFELSKTVAGVFTLLLDLGAVPIVGDRIRLECQGTAIRAYKNDVLVGSVTDSSVTTGQPGVGFWHASSTPTARVELWSGADIVGTIVVPSTAALALAAFAPTVLTPSLVTPATASLALTGFAPSVIVGTVVVPSTAALTLATFAPGVATPVLATPGTASLVLASFAPSVLTPQLVTPATAALSLAGFAPDVRNGVTATPGAAALVVAGLAPTVVATAHQLAVPGLGLLTLAAYAPTVTASGAPAVAEPASDPGLGQFTLDRIKEFAWYYGGRRTRR